MRMEDDPDMWPYHRREAPRDVGGPALRPGDRVYVAARFERQAEALALVGELVRAGYHPRCRWVYYPGLANPENAPAVAEMDLNDVDVCDVYLLLSDDVPGRGGKDFEGGYAFARGKRLVVVGPRVHVFHFLPGVRHYPDLPTFRFLYVNGEKID